jgi:hypothetical protein
MTNQAKDFNIPTIIKVTDSLGNEYIIKEGRAGERLDIIDPTTRQKKIFHHNDRFSFDLTIDPSFEDDSYILNWTEKNGLEVLNDGKKVNWWCFCGKIEREYIEE